MNNKIDSRRDGNKGLKRERKFKTVETKSWYAASAVLNLQDGVRVWFI